MDTTSVTPAPCRHEHMQLSPRWNQHPTLGKCHSQLTGAHDRCHIDESGRGKRHRGVGRGDDVQGGVYRPLSFSQPHQHNGAAWSLHATSFAPLSPALTSFPYSCTYNKNGAACIPHAVPFVLGIPQQWSSVSTHMCPVCRCFGERGLFPRSLFLFYFIFQINEGEISPSRLPYLIIS
jgi:hypothetical protein